MSVLSAADQKVVATVAPTLASSSALKRWLDGKMAGGIQSFQKVEPLVSSFAASDFPPDTATLFYDEFAFNGKKIPVTGVLQEMFFDQARTSPANLDTVCAEFEDFVMRYFLRVTESRRPVLVSPGKQQSGETLAGYGFTQALYKPAGGGDPARFPAEEAAAIIDLREIGVKYEWLVVDASIYNFMISLPLAGAGGPQLSFAMPSSVTGIIHAPFVIRQRDPEPGVAGRYGACFGMPRLPDSALPLLQYGPGLFDPCIHLFQFDVRTDGSIRAIARLVANQPEEILAVPLDPVGPGLGLLNRLSFGMAEPLTRVIDQLPRPLRGLHVDPVLGGIDAANALTGGRAANFGISRGQILRQFMEKHFEADYQCLTGLLRTYRRVRDWSGEVPMWARTGVI